MTDGQLLFKPETQYDIKVANGVISIDYSDIELPNKINKMYEDVQKALNKTDKEVRKLESQGITGEEVFLAQYKGIKDVFKAIDRLFGEGSADLIFPIKSLGAITMFLEMLPNELEKAQKKANKFMDKVTSNEYRDNYAPIKGDNEEIEEL